MYRSILQSITSFDINFMFQYILHCITAYYHMSQSFIMYHSFRKFNAESYSVSQFLTM